MPPVSPNYSSRIVAALVVIVIILLLLLFRADIAALWNTSTAAAIPFEAVEKGMYAGINERKNYVISNQAEWQDLWNIVHMDENPKSPLPEIDFSMYTVLVAFQGERPTGGYEIEINKVTDTGSALAVAITEREPGAGCVVTQAITAPYEIVKVPRFEKNINSVSERVVVPCSS